MPFIGKNPTSGFSTIVKDDFTPDGSTTAFTLSKNVASANDIAVFVGNVRQEPTDAYSVSGTTLTMTAAPASGLNFYVLHISGTLESSVVPADGTITTAKLVNDSVTSAKIANDAVGSAAIADDAVTTAKINANAVTTSELDDDAFHVEKLEEYALSSQTDTIDIDLSSYTSSFDRFKLYVRHVECTAGSIPLMTKLTAANTAVTSGWYGGGSYAGEGISGTAQYSNDSGYHFLGDNTHVTATTTSYLGVWEFDWTHMEDGRLSVTGQGVMRIESGQTCWINSGAHCINTGTQHGIRIQVDGASKYFDDFHYTLYGVRAN